MGLDTLLNLIEGRQEGKDEDEKANVVIPDRSKIFLKMIGPEAQALMIKVSCSECVNRDAAHDAALYLTSALADL